MPITSGGIKFFERSKGLLDDDNTVTASTATAAAKFIIDRNSFTFWRSVGSTDASTETIILLFETPQTFNRVLLLDHNFKGFNIKYDLNGASTNFTSVIGIDGALGGGIVETTFADDTAYYEFDSITTDQLEIEVTTTQTVDAEKFLSQVIPTTELGTLVGFPIVKSITHDRNAREKKMLSGRVLVQKSIETARFKIDFKNYPPSLSDDLDLMMELFDKEDPFLVWMSGGRRGSDYFRYALRGFRLKDVLQMQISKDLKVSYTKNVYIHVVNMQLSLVESI